MKKILVTLFIIHFALFSLFAWQKTYTAESEEYIALRDLSRLAGTALPDITMPCTGDNLLTALETIHPSDLSDEAYLLYEKLHTDLAEPEVLYRLNDIGINAKVALTPFYLFGNVTDSPSKSLDFIERENERAHLFDAKAEFFATRYVYGKVNINGTKIIGEEKRLFDDKFGLITLFSPKKMSQDWPDEALGGIGNKYINFTIGRDKVSAGSGFTGNMYLSHNRQFDDFAKLSVYKNPISYDFTALFYDGYTPDTTGTDLRLRYNDYEGPRKMVFIHRFSSVLFRRVTLSLYEGVVLYGSSILSDLRALNPLMIFHNSGTYYAGNTNNFAGLEVSAAIKKGLSAGVQVVFDQVQLSDESDDSGKTQFGFLANVSHSTILRGGMLTSFVEGVYATDGMYLKEFDNTKNGFNKNGNTFYYNQLDMVTGYKRYANHENDEYKYLGYPDGGCIKKISIGSSYKLKNYKFDAAFSFTAKGAYGIGVNEIRILDRKTDDHSSEQYCVALSLSASGKFLNGGIEGKVVLASVNFWNYQHVKDEKNNQIQLSLLCKIHPLEFFVHRKALD